MVPEADNLDREVGISGAIAEGETKEGGRGVANTQLVEAPQHADSAPPDLTGLSESDFIRNRDNTRVVVSICLSPLSVGSL